ncbi:MAG: Ig-like domain-containing protein [Lachnospiraceae bacterium]|nr:Ig-like domain-containing protein [Lachnospiraceae bacterium]
MKQFLVILLCAALLPFRPVMSIVPAAEELPEPYLEEEADDSYTEDFHVEEISEKEKEELREQIGAESLENIIGTDDFDEEAFRAEIEEKRAYDEGLETGGEDFMLDSARISISEEDFHHYDLEMNAGEKELVDLMALPAGMADLKVTWKSSNKKVATVSKGLITAKNAKSGQAVITVKIRSKAKGASKWIDHQPLTISVNVIPTEVPKKVRKENKYSFSLSSSTTSFITASHPSIRTVRRMYRSFRNGVQRAMLR